MANTQKHVNEEISRFSSLKLPHTAAVILSAFSLSATRGPVATDGVVQESRDNLQRLIAEQTSMNSSIARRVEGFIPLLEATKVAAERAVNGEVSEDYRLGKLVRDMNTDSTLLGRIDTTALSIYEEQAQSSSRAVHRAFIGKFKDQREMLHLYCGLEQGEFEFNRALAVCFVKGLPTEGLTPDQKEVAEYLKSETVAKLSRMYGSEEDRETVTGFGTNQLNQICYAAPRQPLNATKMSGDVKSILIGIAVDWVVSLNIQNLQTDYKNKFKELSPKQALECLQRASEQNLSKWVQTNLNMCTLSPTTTIGAPSELLNTLCPNIQSSFSEELDRCIIDRIERMKKESSSSSPSSTYDKGSGYRPERHDEKTEKERSPQRDSPRKDSPKERPSRESPSRPGRGDGIA